jgi:hypothetical protein
LKTKLTNLGWSAIMQLPVDRIPGIIRDILPTIISRCLQLVKELDDANQDDDEDDLGEEDDEDEEDEEGGEEEEDEENEEVEDEDDTEDQEEIAYLKSLKNESRKLFAMAKEYQDDGVSCLSLGLNGSIFLGTTGLVYPEVSFLSVSIHFIN